MAKKFAYGFVVGLVVTLTYLLSFAPFLRYHPDAASPYYRSPQFYRPAEWVLLRTPLQSPLLWWSHIVGSRSETEWQLFFLAQGTTDPSEEWHFNLLDD